MQIRDPYYYLKNSDVIQETDEFFDWEDWNWYPVPNLAVGQTYGNTPHNNIRRKVEP
jgi:hypothetical protein